ncbi:NAD-P-binding protein [Vararia minispora EC-137]|uniref:NAD-P-binding protein n=1 Tax=Vararia minispora EC-137 TaxID=1314806 RepID=A0ACB8Q8L8_9AGAM|nr:NAD-P-binding protein [Vararia minispora EC-137]
MAQTAPSSLSKFLSNVEGASENMPASLTRHHGVYPAIDPKSHIAGQTYRDKVVLITGASTGIGRETAILYARAGASVVLVARNAAVLEEARQAATRVGAEARVLAVCANVCVPERAEDAVKQAIEAFGRLDILIANAGVGVKPGQCLSEVDPLAWWSLFEVNVLGVYNFVRYAMAHLQKTNGYIIATSSGMAQLRYPGMSSYAISKMAVNRLVEFIDLEYPEVKTFALHPGTIRTGINAETPELPTPDSAALPAALSLHITAGKVDWMHGRYISANWDVEELEKDWKNKILEQRSLVAKLAIPT